VTAATATAAKQERISSGSSSRRIGIGSSSGAKAVSPPELALLYLRAVRKRRVKRERVSCRHG
jgi:hypothetical protein